MLLDSVCNPFIGITPNRKIWESTGNGIWTCLLHHCYITWTLSYFKICFSFLIQSASLIHTFAPRLKERIGSSNAEWVSTWGGIPVTNNNIYIYNRHSFPFSFINTSCTTLSTLVLVYSELVWEDTYVAVSQTSLK